MRRTRDCFVARRAGMDAAVRLRRNDLESGHVFESADARKRTHDQIALPRALGFVAVVQRLTAADGANALRSDCGL